jgi:MarR-like DNA-binding transcriptional regulator SgrR of sgrS sRNA
MIFSDLTKRFFTHFYKKKTEKTETCSTKPFLVALLRQKVLLSFDDFFLFRNLALCVKIWSKSDKVLEITLLMSKQECRQKAESLKKVKKINENGHKLVEFYFGESFCCYIFYNLKNLSEFCHYDFYSWSVGRLVELKKNFQSLLLRLN